MCNSLNDQPKRKVLHVLGKTILKIFIQKSMQQNVQIDMITADARASYVLHDTSTKANTPGPIPFLPLISFNKLTETTTTIKTIKNQSEVTRNVYLLCVLCCGVY